jgi:hypothetical protein
MDCGRLVDARPDDDDYSDERCPDCGGTLEELGAPLRRFPGSTSRDELTGRLVGIGA